jgi:hypothetical protein
MRKMRKDKKVRLLCSYYRPFMFVVKCNLEAAILNPKGFRLNLQLKSALNLSNGSPCKGLQLLVSAALCKSAVDHPTLGNP